MGCYKVLVIHFFLVFYNGTMEIEDFDTTIEFIIKKLLNEENFSNGIQILSQTLSDLQAGQLRGLDGLEKSLEETKRPYPSIRILKVST